MFRTELLHLKLVKGLEQWDPSQLLQRFSARFGEPRSFGFIGTESYDRVISSTMVYRSIVVRSQFDPVRNIIVSQPQVVFDHTPFRVDYGTGLLEAGLGGRRLVKLVSVLGTLFDFRITIQDVYINLKAFVRELDASNHVYDITNVTVTNFRPEAGLSGRFTASVYEQRAARELIREYGKDVVSVNVEPVIDGSAMIWRLSSTGTIAVRAEEEVLEQGVIILRNTVLRCKDA
jgi:hypothetical protein